MKRFSLTTLFCFFIFGISAQVPVNGLIGYWPLDANANDHSGNNNHGTVSGAAPTTDRFGNANSAYLFNGTTDFIEIAHSATLNFGAAPFTISVWFQRFSSNTNDWIVSKEISTAPDGQIFELAISDQITGSRDKVFFESANGTAGIGMTWDPINGHKLGSIDTVLVGQWYNAVVTRNGKNYQWFVNGVLQAIDTTTTGGTIDHSVNLNNVLFGAAHDPNGIGKLQHFHGKIDDVRFYNRVLDSTEITEVFNEMVCAQPAPDITTNLIAYYPFNGDANDATISNYHGANNGATLTTDRFGNPNSAYDFNGTSSYIDVGDAVPLRLNNTDYTISFWTDINAYTTAGTAFVYKRGFGSATGWAIGAGAADVQNRTHLIVSEGTDPRGYTTAALPTGNWHHVAAVYSLSAQQVTFYIDGVLDNSTTGVDNNFVPTNGIPSPGAINNSVMRFGQDSKNAAYWLNGKLDDIRIYNRALSSCDIDSLFNTTPCTLNSANLIGTSGTTTFCTGDSVMLTALQGTTYLWNNGATTASIVASASGTYTLTASEGIGCSVTNSEVVTVHPISAAPVITPSGSTSLCADESVTLTSSAAGNNVWSTGATTGSITVDSSGTFTVSYTDGNGCASAMSAPVAVSVNPLPPAPVITANGATTFCEGGNVTLTSSQPSGNLWSNGATTSAITVDSSETLTVTYTDGNGCVSAPSTPIAVSELSSQLTVTMSTQGTNTCYGDSDGAVKVNVVGGAVPYTYQWSNGDTVNTISDLAGGTYTVTVTDANSCSISDTVAIGEGAFVDAGNIAGADTADINVNESYSAFAGFSYTWTVTNGSIVSGQGTNTIVVDWTATPQGVIEVIATDQGCSDTLSRTIALIDLVGVAEVLRNNIELYPNPTSSIVTLKAGRGVLQNTSDALILKLYDFIGKEVLLQTVASSALQQGVEIDMSALNEGAYFLLIETDTGLRAMKVMKH